MDSFKETIFAEGHKVQQSPDVVFKDILDESVLLHLGTANYYALNETGTTIWRFCADPRLLPEIVDFLCSEYECGPEKVEPAIRFYLVELLKEKLLQAVSP